MARSIWSGSISFGMIPIPVKLFTAVRPKGVSFNQIDERTMSRIATRRSPRTPVRRSRGPDRQGRGHLQGPLRDRRPRRAGTVRQSPAKSIDLEEFVELAEIDPIYFETS